MNLQNIYITKILLGLMLLCNIHVNNVYTQENGKRITSKGYFDFDSINVISDSTLFNGYLIFKINKNPDHNVYVINDSFYSCDVFWVTHIEDIQCDSTHYLYNFFTLAYNQYVSENDYLNNKSEKYLEFKKVFNKYINNSKYNQDTIFLLNQTLNTRIFRKAKFWTFESDNNNGYFIFDISMSKVMFTSIYSIYNKKDNLSQFYGKFFIPISKFYKFSETLSPILIELGYKKSKWYPKKLYVK